MKYAADLKSTIATTFFRLGSKSGPLRNLEMPVNDPLCDVGVYTFVIQSAVLRPRVAH